MTEFIPFPKIARLSRECIVTEKLDGTNGQILIAPADEIGPEGLDPTSKEAAFQDAHAVGYKDGMAVYVGSRNRWIKPGDDNFGFAAWVYENLEELLKLGPGSHFGEWWGQGIQRGYGLDHKRFSLFNVARWGESRPACCHVVPVLYRGMFDTFEIETALDRLAFNGSEAAPGFMNPEGVVVYHTSSRTLFKKTLDKNDAHKEL